MKFFKSTNREHPHHDLPTVEWDPLEGKSRFEFTRGESGLLEFETYNQELIDELMERGYGYEVVEEAAPTVKKTMVLREDDQPHKKSKNPMSTKIAPKQFPLKETK